MVKYTQFITKNPKETQSLGAKLGRVLRPKDLILLTGDLGAGKTTFIQGLGKGLNAKEVVNSPSFVLINEYRSGIIPMIHLDLYRLDNLNQIEELGLSDYLNQQVVMVVEWGEKMKELLPAGYFEIRFEKIRENERKICISPELAARLKN